MEGDITTKANANLEELEAKFAEWGCERIGVPPILFEADDEQVIIVSCPEDLPRKVHDKDPIIIKVSPNSPQTKYSTLGVTRPS
jgi:hypothetical protein